MCNNLRITLTIANIMLASCFMLWVDQISLTLTSEAEIIEKITWQLPGGEWAGVGQGTIWLALKH